MIENHLVVNVPATWVVKVIQLDHVNRLLDHLTLHPIPQPTTRDHRQQGQNDVHDRIPLKTATKRPSKNYRPTSLY
jgi:hypothetical protein